MSRYAIYRAAGERTLTAHADDVRERDGVASAWNDDENVIDTLTDIAHAVGRDRWNELLGMARRHVEAELDVTCQECGYVSGMDDPEHADSCRSGHREDGARTDVHWYINYAGDTEIVFHIEAEYLFELEHPTGRIVSMGTINGHVDCDVCDAQPGEVSPVETFTVTWDGRTFWTELEGDGTYAGQTLRRALCGLNDTEVTA